MQTPALVTCSRADILTSQLQEKSAATPGFYRPELDALRFAAFLMVWTSHSLPNAEEAAAHRVQPALLWWIEAIKDAGNFGVCVFFFLSAYLITELLRRERAATGTVHLRAFYLRRILRIWPLYLGVLALYAVLGLRFHGFRIEPGRLLASLLLAGNWYIAFHPAILTPMRALWSLSVEEQFYLVWPLLARQVRRSALAAFCAGVFAVAVGTLLWLPHKGSEPAMLHVTAWVNSLVQFQYFALGALAALWLNGSAIHLPPWLRPALLSFGAIAMLVAAGVCGIKRPQPWHSAGALVGGYALVGFGCALLFAAVLGVEARIVPRWTISLGRVSFGLYVFHETGFFFADAIEKRLLHHSGEPARVLLQTHWLATLGLNKGLSLIFTVLLAFASYRFWERPFLRLKERFAFVRTKLA